jgi:hypothetical protein
MTDDTFAVQFSPLSGRIRAGRVNKAGDAFTRHGDVSGQAIWAVAQWLEAHDAGWPYEIYRNVDGTGGGYRLTVERIP